MNPELDRKLCEKYPEIFCERGESPMESCMHWGFECGDGWYNLIDAMCTKLKVIADMTGMQVVANQVKEKYAELRFYYTITTAGKESNPDQKCLLWSSVVDDVVDSACSKSSSTCEECGEHGRIVRRGGWWMTRCEKHVLPDDLVSVHMSSMITLAEEKAREKADWDMAKKKWDEERAEQEKDSGGGEGTAT